MVSNVFTAILFSVLVPIFGVAKSIDRPSSVCASMLTSPTIKALLSAVEKTESASAGISNYRISDFDLVLLDSNNFPNCKMNRNHDGTVLVEETAPIKIENQVYDFCGGLQTTCSIPGLGSRTNGVTIFDVGFLGKRALEVFPANPDEMLNLIAFSLLSHEGFHFYIQSGQFSLTGFPRYETSLEWSNRQRVGESCYGGSTEIERLVSEEMQLLNQAFLAARGNVLNERSQLLKRFIETRERRYDLVSNIKISDKGIDLSCRAAEARMEVTEGIADFAGLWALGQAEGWAAVDKYYQMFFDDMKQSSEHYYRLGSLQIFSLISDEESKSMVFSKIRSSKILMRRFTIR